VVTAARAAPDTITYGSPGNGTTIHLAGHLFEKAANINIRHIPYKGSNPALMDALAGNVDLLVSSLPSAIAQLKAGKLRALAVTSAARSSSLPDVPTVAESGYKDFDVATWYGLFMPAGTPATIVTTMNTKVNELLANPEVKTAIAAQGAEPQAMKPEQFSNLLKADYAKWKGIVQASGPRLNKARTYTLSDFDFVLPEHLIAQHPAPERSGSRLLDGRQCPSVDRIFRELPTLLKAGDLLVFNDTKVLNARLFGEKATGGKVELLVERVLSGNQVAAHMRVSKKPEVGATIKLICAAGHDDGLRATMLGRWPNAEGPLYRFVLSNDAGDTPYTLMERHGHVPLPPYITHTDSVEDAQRYQTVFAKNPGAVAAPTAALHFDEALLAQFDAMGVQRAHVTLHVGAGTFQPVKTENLSEHQMHSEWYEVPAATQQAIADCKARGGRVVAVGTTTVRTLESWAQTGMASGDTTIFITPGFDFKLIDVLVTNFHLPKSSLMMLVSAFAGYEHIMALYRDAIAREYRFFSYGDAMLLPKATTQ
jgi:S-adenosylmethionine:tRNA ribosyltransferase-isomerase